MYQTLSPHQKALQNFNPQIASFLTLHNSCHPFSGNPCVHLNVTEVRLETWVGSGRQTSPLAFLPPLTPFVVNVTAASVEGFKWVKSFLSYLGSISSCKFTVSFDSMTRLLSIFLNEFITDADRDHDIKKIFTAVFL